MGRNRRGRLAPSDVVDPPASPAQSGVVGRNGGGVLTCLDPGRSLAPSPHRFSLEAVSQKEAISMADAARISVQEARQRVASGQALLVCAYEDEEKCSKIKLEGATTVKKLEAQLSSVPKNREIIFYCA
jgi:hypothetical protein